MRLLLVCAGLALLNTAEEAVGMPEDTGWIPFMQPDGTQFTARTSCDEHTWLMETPDGYRIAPRSTPSGLWYEYATLDAGGEYAPSGAVVGRVDPELAGIELGLERSPERQERTKMTRPQADGVWPAEGGQGDDTPAGRVAKTTLTVTGTFYLKVLLVKFPDVANSPVFTKAHFDAMLFGAGYDKTSPSSQWYYGSLAQYFADMSRNASGSSAFTVSNAPPGGIVNQIDAYGKPIWLMMPSNKMTYHDGLASDFVAAAKVVAANAGRDTTTDSDERLVVVYAGNMYKTEPSHPNGGLHPQAQNVPYQRKWYTQSELWIYTASSREDPNARFSLPGVHCHEFGHLLGLEDHYVQSPLGAEPDYGRWGLMAHGGNKATSVGDIAPDRGSCPAPVEPYYRRFLGWLTLSDAQVDREGRSIAYADPIATDVCKVGMPSSSSEYFIVENRQVGTGWNQYLTGSQTGGLLIWHISNAGDGYSLEGQDLIEADGSNAMTLQGESGDVWPGTSGKRLLSDYTSPHSHRQNGTNSGVVLNDISNNGTTMTADLLYNVAYVAAGGSLQTAINNTGSGRSVVALPGTYTAGVSMRSGVNLIGSGRTATTIDVPYPETAVILSGVNDVQIKGIKLASDHSMVVQVTNCGSGLRLKGCEVYLKQSRSAWGLSISGGTSGLGVEQCWFHDCNYGAVVINAVPTFSNANRFYANNTGVMCLTQGLPILTPQNNLSYPTVNVSYDVRADASVTGNINASYCFWNGSPRVRHDGSGTIITSNPLANPAAKVATEGSMLALAQDRLNSGDVAEALEQFKAIIASPPSEDEAVGAVHGVVFASNRTSAEIEAALSYLSRIGRDRRGSEVGAAALYASISGLVCLGRPDEALSMTDRILADHPGSRYAPYALWERAFVLRYSFGDEAGARRAFGRIVAEHPDWINAPQARAELDALTEGVDASSSEDLPALVVSSYPNPANPSAAIQFALRETARVTITLYDLLGQPIRTLADGAPWGPGAHVVAWDGRDGSGQAAATGVYVCTVKAGAIRGTARVVLVR